MGFSDDVIYCVLLLFSVPLGHLIKTSGSYKKKQHISSAVGALIVVAVCGLHGLHSVFTIAVNALIIRLWPRKCHMISFIWCFGYIVFFRTTQYFGLPSVPPHCNAVQLILTLKLVGLAHEVSDTVKNEDELKKSEGEEKIRLKNKYQNIYPSVWDMFMYGYCFIGLLTGPYFKYRTYQDMLQQTNGANIYTIKPCLHKIKWVPFFAACFLVGSYFFKIEYTKMDEFYEEPFWFRAVFMTPMFFLFRMRFYVAWTLAECSCITAGLGAYPIAARSKIGGGPTDYEALAKSEQQSPEGRAYDFETVRNLDIYGCELAPTVREGVRSWNTTVQYWLANMIYKRLTFKAGHIKVAITMSVSAFWHGIYPGYYMSFLLVPLCMLGEEKMAAAFRNNKSPRQQVIFDWCCWFFKTRFLDYMCMSFLLLKLQDIFRYWASIYFLGHVMAVFFICVGMYFKPKKSKKIEDRSTRNDAASATLKESKSQ